MSVVTRFVPVDLRGCRAVVVGASIAGLASALALGERGAEVLILEADPEPGGDSAEDAFLGWSRRKVPQFRHSHVFLARLRSILLRAYPEIYQALLDQGARELRLLDFPPPAIGTIAPEPGDEELATIGCRRTTFEWVLRRHVEAAPWARVLAGQAAIGLLADAGPIPAVRGIRIDDGQGRRRSTIGADLVIDASGRNSRAAHWLEAIGAAPPREERSPSSILYYTRFYRIRPGRELPAPGGEPTMADFGWIKFAIFPADAGVFSVTFATHLAIPRLKVLQHPAAFEEMAGTFPGLAPYVAADLAEPIAIGDRDILAMGGLENCRRRFVDDSGEPLARNFFAIGDSAYHTNPLYGRGSAQAFMHAGLLGEALDAAAGDAGKSAAFLDELARAEIEPFYQASVAADLHANRRVGALPASRAERLLDSFFEDGVLPATRVDPVVFRAFTRMMNMIETPEQAFFHPEVMPRVVAVWLRGTRFRSRVMPSEPDRSVTIAACEHAAGLATFPQKTGTLPV